MMSDKEQEKIDHFHEAKELGLNPFANLKWAKDNPDNLASRWENGVEMMDCLVEWLDRDDKSSKILRKVFGNKSPEFLAALAELFPGFSKIRDFIVHGDVG